MPTTKIILILSGTAIAGAAAVTWALAATAQPPVNHALFATSDQCIACHADVHAPNGEDISLGYSWRATMMANSARDPYWHAGVRREIMDHPQAKAAIEDTCSTCHMPMARFQAHAAGGAGEILRHLELLRANPAAPLPAATALAMDGVSCTTCHQIRPDNFGMETSFDGGFVIDTGKPPEQRDLFGRYAVDNARARVMHSATGFAQAQSDHLQQSELCATCHTLYTHALDAEGRPAGVLPEQVPYQEWLRSEFAGTRSCQSCHIPRMPGTAPLSSVLGQPRPDVPRHDFLGGNAFMLRILNIYRAELGTKATAQELETAARRTETLLREETATLAVSPPRLRAGRLEFDVTVGNLTGHKLPTAYPSRRVWLHVTVRDASGAVVFESGAPQPDGAIAGNDNDLDGRRFEPHYATVTAADQVQIYEPIMVDSAGRVTTGLLFGVRYAKDNRLLPRGFEKRGAPEDVAVRGEAAADEDFAAGSDRVGYSVPIPGGAGPWRVSAELLYQSIGFRWARNLEAYDAFETKRFLRYFEENAAASSKLLAAAEAAGG